MPECAVSSLQGVRGISKSEVTDVAMSMLTRSKIERSNMSPMHLGDFGQVGQDCPNPCHFKLITDLVGRHLDEYAQRWAEVVGVSNALAKIVGYFIS